MDTDTPAAQELCLPSFGSFYAQSPHTFTKPSTRWSTELPTAWCEARPLHDLPWRESGAEPRTMAYFPSNVVAAALVSGSPAAATTPTPVVTAIEAAFVTITAGLRLWRWRHSASVSPAAVPAAIAARQRPRCHCAAARRKQITAKKEFTRPHQQHHYCYAYKPPDETYAVRMRVIAPIGIIAQGTIPVLGTCMSGLWPCASASGSGTLHELQPFIAVH